MLRGWGESLICVMQKSALKGLFLDFFLSNLMGIKKNAFDVVKWFESFMFFAVKDAIKKVA